MHPRLMLHVWLAFLLLFGQAGAQLHMLSHLAAPVTSEAPKDQHLPHTQSCDKCLAFAQFGSTVHASAPTVLGAFGDFLHTDATVASISTELALSFLARGPPFRV